MRPWGFVLALGVLLLAACDGTPGAVPAPVQGGGSDPYAMRDAANAAIQATGRAKAEQEAQATEQAAKDEQKSKRQVQALMAPITATAAALDLQATAGAATQQAAVQTATATAALATAAVQAQQATATTQAYVERRSFEQTRAIAWNILWGAIVLGGTAAGTYIAYILIKRWMDEKIKREKERLVIEQEQAEAEKRRAQLVFPGNGEVWWIGPNGPMKLEGASKQALSATTPYSVSGNGFIPMEPAGNGKNAVKDTNGLAKDLVNLSIQAYGENSDQLAGWRVAGITSSKWSRIMRSFDAENLIQTIVDENDKKKKVVLIDADRGGYPNLRALYNALTNGKLILHPSSFDPTLPYSFEEVE